MKGRLPHILMLLLLIACGTSCDRSKVRHYNEGNQLSEEGVLTDAIGSYDQALTEDETFLWALNNRGTAFLRFHDCEAAIADFTAAAEQDGDYREAFYNRGICNLKTENYEEAFADFDQLLLLDRSWNGSYYGFAVTHWFQNDWETALDLFEEELQLDTATIANLLFKVLQSEDTLTLGETYAKEDRVSFAAPLRKLRRDYLQTAVFDASLAAEIIEHRKAYRDSLPHFDALAKCTRIDTIVNYALYGRALCLQRNDYFDAAIRDYRMLLHKDTTFMDAYLNLGWCLQSEGNYHEARQYYAHVVTVDSNFVFGRFNLALCNYELGLRDDSEFAYNFFERALDFFDTVIYHEPELSRAHYYRGACYQQLYFLLKSKADRDSALTAYGRTIDLNDQMAAAFFNRANLLLLQRDTIDALADYNAVLDLRPDYRNAYYMRGVIRYETGDPDGACEDFHQAMMNGHKEAYKKIRSHCRGIPPSS